MKAPHSYEEALQIARESVQAIDIKDASSRTGGEILSGKYLKIPFFHIFTFARFSPYEFHTEPETNSPLIETVLLHYISNARPIGPGEEWITFKELPSGIFYYHSFQQRSECRIEELFQKDFARTEKKIQEMGGRKQEDFSYVFTPLPRILLKLVYVPPDEEFPGQAILFFDNASHLHLPSEDLAGISEWMTDFLENQP